VSPPPAEHGCLVIGAGPGKWPVEATPRVSLHCPPGTRRAATGRCRMAGAFDVCLSPVAAQKQTAREFREGPILLKNSLSHSGAHH
jgi:hypothetical protein